MLQLQSAMPILTNDGTQARADVVMFTLPFCGYCERAARLLTSKGVSFRRIDVSANNACRRWLVEATGMGTLPQIFVNGRSVRGYDDIAALDRRGLLEPLLNQAPDPAAASPLPAAPLGTSEPDGPP